MVCLMVMVLALHIYMGLKSEFAKFKISRPTCLVVLACDFGCPNDAQIDPLLVKALQAIIPHDHCLTYCPVVGWSAGQ